MGMFSIKAGTPVGTKITVPTKNMMTVLRPDGSILSKMFDVEKPSGFVICEICWSLTGKEFAAKHFKWHEDNK